MVVSSQKRFSDDWQVKGVTGLEWSRRERSRRERSRRERRGENAEGRRPG